MSLRVPMAAVTASALALIACPKAKPPPPPLPRQKLSVDLEVVQQVQALSDRAENLLRRQEEAVWKNWTAGLPIQMEKTYAEFQDLFELSSLRKIDQLRSTLAEQYQCSQRRAFQVECSLNKAAAKQLFALDHLRAHFLGELLSQALSEANFAIANLEASLSFSANGGEHRFQDLERLLANERTPEGRHALYAGATSAVLRLSEMVRRKDEKLDHWLQDLGYGSHQALGNVIRQTNLGELVDLAEGVLRETSEPYRQALAALAQRELNVSLDRSRRCDFDRLFRSKATNAAFSRDALLTRVDQTLKGLGISLNEMANLTIDAQSRPTKNPRPLTLAVSVPADVRLSFRPVGGARDQSLLFHEMGHALHPAFTTASQRDDQQSGEGFLPDPRFALNKLGNRAVNEAYALLFDALPENPDWLEDAGVSHDKSPSYLLAARTYRLFQLRRRSGRLLYELKLHQVAAGEGKPLYRQIMEPVYGVTLSADDQARYLIDRDDLYQSADELRASFLAAQLHGFLVERFGPRWWRNLQAGDFLRGLWSHGNAWSAEEVVESLGQSAVKPDALLRQLGADSGTRESTGLDAGQL